MTGANPVLSRVGKAMGRRLVAVVLLLLAAVPAARCQALSAGSAGAAASLNTIRIAQANPQVPTPGVIPTDVTPIGITQEQSLFGQGVKFRIFQKLPERLWFNSTTEASYRLDTNVFFTSRNNKADGAFRILPNITIGYNLFKRFSIYTNYFVIKDLFANNARLLNFPTTQSLSLGFRQDVPITRRTNLQLDFQARELWQTSHLHQFDFLPSANLTHVFTPNFIGFGSLVLQLRGREFFVAPTREIDPFYTVGFLFRRGLWNFTATNTFVTNYRSPPFHGSIPQQGNFSMISDFEVSRPVHRKVPNLQAFMRIEPIWNWNSHYAPGLSGFDYRMFGGLRLSLNKPSYNASIDQLRQQLLESEGGDGGSQQPSKPAPPKTQNPGGQKEPAISLSPPGGRADGEVRMFISQPPADLLPVKAIPLSVPPGPVPALGPTPASDG